MDAVDALSALLLAQSQAVAPELDIVGDALATK